MLYFLLACHVEAQHLSTLTLLKFLVFSTQNLISPSQAGENLFEQSSPKEYAKHSQALWLFFFFNVSI